MNAHNFTLAIDSQTDDHVALILVAVPANIDIKGRFIMYDEHAMDVAIAPAFCGLPYHQITSDTDKYLGELANSFLEDFDDVGGSHYDVFGNITEEYDYIHHSVNENLPEEFYEKLKPLVNVMDNLTSVEDVEEANRQVAEQLKALDIMYLGV